MTHSAQVLAELAKFNAPDEMLIQIGQLQFWGTKTQGVHIVNVSPGREIQHIGVLWNQPEEVK